MKKVKLSDIREVKFYEFKCPGCGQFYYTYKAYIIQGKVWCDYCLKWYEVDKEGKE